MHTAHLVDSPQQGRTSIHYRPELKPVRNWRTWLLGSPIRTADAAHQKIGRLIGLAVFASDALSSTAYATQEILVILIAAGMGALHFAFPIALAIVSLLAVVTISYQQTIHAYPDGGGAYIVARDNLGELAAQIAGAALLTDYILTVAVSISSGVAQIVSAYPELHAYRAIVAVAMVLMIMVVNLRGVKESGLIFSIPSYLFLIMMVLTLGVGFARLVGGGLGVVSNPPSIDISAPLTGAGLFLVLHAFSSGTTALTGVEAISNGITAFKEPRSHNAAVTLIWMASILAVLFLGITYLTSQVQAVPSEAETVISQLARTIYGGRNLLYLVTISSTTLILIMAANTAFADFPRLSALAAVDGFLPRQLTYRGSRLVFSWGITLLAVAASLLIVVFQASVSALIPLYAIGVFMSFTISQFGMARRWMKSSRLQPGEMVKERGSELSFDRHWTTKMVINGVGAVCTFVVMMVFAGTKFTHGAWVVLLVIPFLVLVFQRIHGHYQRLASNLSLENSLPVRLRKRNRVLLLISGVHRGSLQALYYARSLSSDVTAVHVSIDPDASGRLKQKWDKWGEQTRLVIIDSPYRVLLDPLLAYIDHLRSTQVPGDQLTIVVPQFIPESRWSNILHSQTALWLRNALLGQKGIVIIEVPYQVE